MCSSIEATNIQRFWGSKKKLLSIHLSSKTSDPGSISNSIDSDSNSSVNSEPKTVKLKDLDSNWELYRDITSGNTFYHNKETRNSQWEMPAEIVTAKFGSKNMGNDCFANTDIQSLRFYKMSQKTTLENLNQQSDDCKTIPDPIEALENLALQEKYLEFRTHTIDLWKSLLDPDALMTPDERG